MALCLGCGLPMAEPSSGACVAQAASNLLGGSEMGPEGLAEGQRAAIAGLWSDGEPTCTAVLVDPHWLLTASHCRSVYRGSEPSARFNLPDGNTSSLQLGQPVEHPSLDLMLIPVGTVPDQVQALRLAPHPLAREQIGERVTIAGQGLTEEQRHELRFAHQFVSEVDDNDIVVDGQGQSGACEGDSGGPLLVELGEQFLVAGILHGGSASCRDRDIFTRVDTQLEWLERYLPATEDMSCP